MGYSLLSLADENVHLQRAGFCTLATCVLTHGRCSMLVSVWTGCPPLHPFSVFVGSRAWGIFHTHFSFLSFCGLFHGTQMKERRVCLCALRPIHTRGHTHKMLQSVASFIRLQPPLPLLPKVGAQWESSPGWWVQMAAGRGPKSQQ